VSTGSHHSSDLHDPAELAHRIQEMGKWFHNLNINGVYTAPDHFLGDFPNIKWQKICKEIPASIAGKSVLDIGCNGGFYSIEMKRRGADYVLGIDVDDRYLNQARFASQALGFDIDFRKCSVYELDSIPGQFDYVIFMGVFYHLRYPLLGLDLAVKKAARTFIFQSMLRGSNETGSWASDYSSDPTNWWIPNRSAAEAMLRSAGLTIISHPEHETWICQPQSTHRDGRYVVDLEFAGELAPEEEEGDDLHGGSRNVVE
jgi:tRNA (mo5U34)-methyltransferase